MLRNASKLMLPLLALGLFAVPGRAAAQTAAATPTGTNSLVIRGDVNGDGQVTILDALAVLAHVVGKALPTSYEVLPNADANGDGQVTAMDALVIAGYAMGRDVARFPVGAAVEGSRTDALDCTATVSTLTVTCRSQRPGLPDGAHGLIVGGQNVYMKLTNTGNAFDGGTRIFSTNVRLTNLIPQPLGVDSLGVTDPEGIRIFHHVLSPNSVTVANADGSGTFLAANQPYFQYLGNLAQGDSTAAKPWQWHLPAGVESFNFKVYISAVVPKPNGWVDIYPGADTLTSVGSTVTLVDSVRNPVGNYVPGQTVTWSSSNTGVATVNASTGVVTAVGDGTTTITAQTANPHRTGTATIVVTTNSAANTTIDAAPATVTAGDSSTVNVQVKNSLGNNVTTGGDAVVLNASAGTLTTVTDNGNGTYTAKLTSNAAGAVTVSGTLNGIAIGDSAVVNFTAGAPANMVKSAGDAQTGTAGSAVATPPAVTITDSNGNPVAGVAVTFTVTGGGGSVAGTPATTNASGVAALTSWTLGTAAGANTLDASATGLTTVTFTATGVAGAAANMVKSAGDAQSATAGSAVAIAPAVTITDANNNPVAGVSVTFAVASGGGSVTGSPVATNASGVATLGSWTLGTTAGANSLDASATGLTTVTFTATGTPGALDHFAVESAAGGNIGDQLSGTPFNVKVTAKDANNNTATSFTGTVGFTSTPGGAITAGAGPSAAFTAGVLSSHAITMGTPGTYTLTATRTGGSETGTSNSFQVQAAPTAVNDGPTPTSVPGDPYHAAFNTTYNLPTLGILANDTRGFPLATVASFGAGSLGGSVTDHTQGSTVSPLPGHADGSLTVNADGSLTFTPYTGFTGLYTFQYRISNVRGTSDATVTIAVGVRPAANADTYPANLLGNVPINTATSSNFNVATNDAGDAKVLALGSASNGTAVLNANGTFTFTPNAGYTGPASFTYTVTNGFGTTAPATVSMTVSGIAWFVDKGAAAGDGRFGTPFNDLSTAFAAATKPQANQPVFLYSSGTSYSGGVTLLAGQRLVGQGATGTSFASVMGVTWPADAGTQPSIGGTNPTVGTGTLTLGSGNTLQGFNLGGSTTLAGTGFGTLTISQVGINTTAQALNLTTGTLSGSLTGLTSSGGTNNVALSGVTLNGAFAFGSGALSGASGSALTITNGVSATATDVLSYSGNITNATAGAANAAVAVSGGSTRLTLTGNVTQTNAGAAVSVSGGHTGTLTFNTGTVSATNGTGLQFDNSDGSYDFGSTPTLSLAGGDAGIDVLNGSAGTFAFPSVAVITNPTAEAIRINASSPTFTYLGRITKTNGSTGITVTNNSSGTISFGSRLKTITSTGANVAVNLATNGTAAISSLDSLVITSATGNGYNATGGGTVLVSGANNTITAVGGIALNVSSTTIAAGGLTFRSIAANGGSNGIVLSSTGTNAGLTVTGDGVAHGSGGTIQNTTGTDGTSAGNGVYLSNARSVNLSWMNLSNHGNHAIYGTEVTAIAFNRLRITGTNGSNTANDDGSIGFDNLYGSATITSSYIDGGFEDNVRVVNGLTPASATLNRLTMTSDTIGYNGNTGNDGVLIAGYGTAVVNATIQNSKFTGSRSNNIQYTAAENASGNIVITGNTMPNTHPAKLGSDFGIYVSHASSGAVSYQIANNIVNNAGGSGIEVDRLAGSNGAMGGSVTGNTVGTSGVAGTGSAAGAGIFIGMVGSSALGTGAVHTDTVSGNTVRQFGNYGIKVVNRGTGTNYLSVQVKNNNVAEPYNAAVTLFPTSGLRFEMGASSVGPDDGKSCFDISGNTLVNTGTNGAAEIRLFGRFGSKTGLPGLTAAGANALIQGQNTITTAGTAVNATSTNAFQSTCPPV